MCVFTLNYMRAILVVACFSLLWADGDAQVQEIEPEKIAQFKTEVERSDSDQVLALLREQINDHPEAVEELVYAAIGAKPKFATQIVETAVDVAPGSTAEIKKGLKAALADHPELRSSYQPHAAQPRVMRPFRGGGSGKPPPMRPTDSKTTDSRGYDYGATEGYATSKKPEHAISKNTRHIDGAAEFYQLVIRTPEIPGMKRKRKNPDLFNEIVRVGSDFLLERGESTIEGRFVETEEGGQELLL
ncbi:MAG: hypothetical protein ACI9R3_003916, partial [Verrucomicrobiales bacterium]